MAGRKDCNIYIKERLYRQIEHMPVEDYEKLREDLKERNINLIRDF